MKKGSRLNLIVAAFAVVLMNNTAAAQTTNIFTNNVGNTFWSIPGNWLLLTNSPNAWTGTNFYPDGVGTIALVTNNISSDRIIFLTNDITVGKLLWGDYGAGQYRDLRSTNGSITFDNGITGVMALFEHGTGDRVAGDYGRYDDDMDAAIHVNDADGLFIDNYQTFYFNTVFNVDPTRMFDGGGHDVTKGEDGSLIFRGIVTNIATFTVRDGFVEVQQEGEAARMPGISNLVIGVAPGVIDTGANPDGVRTNIAEGTINDRSQLPYFSILGANVTNYSSVSGFQPGTTNDMDITINRGIFRSYQRWVATTNGAPPAVYSGTVTLNGSNTESFIIIENQTLAGYTTALRQAFFIAPITGSGGFTKMGSGEMTLTTNNTFSGALAINRSFDLGKGRYGGIGLREYGTLDAVSSIALNRDGQLYIDNSVINLSNRVNDAAAIMTRGRNAIEMMGHASEASYERFGAVSNLMGASTFEFDQVDATPQSQVIDIANLYRVPGSVVTFQASDLQQGVLASTGSSSIAVNLLDGGASLLRVGAGGGAGTVTQSVVVGVFGGDGVDYGSTDPALRTPDRADEFMTVDGNRLRTLRDDEMVSLGARSTNALYISQASASADANVNIDFMSREELLGNSGLTNAGRPDAITKQVVDDATFNSIRLGIVRGTAGNPNEAGRTLVMLDGVKLTSESGMLLIGRDTGSTNGDLTPNGTLILAGGTLDLDGASGNREAIVHNSSGNSIILRSALEATNGLTKSGEQYAYLDQANNLGGTVTVAQGRLYLRDNNAVRGASEIVVNDGGGLFLSQGVAVTNVDLRIGERPYTTDEALYSDGNHNIFGGNILIDNVDPEGVIIHEARITAGGQNSSLTLLGDIGLTGELPSADITLNEPQVIRTSGSQGIINLYGTIGDRIVDGQAVPFDPALRGLTRVEGGWIGNRASAENDLLKFRIDGSGLTGDELVVNISNPWNAAGRLYVEQGTVRFLGDGNFYTSNALAVANFANGQSGFQMAYDGSDTTNSATFLLTKDGQAFNAERWYVNADYYNNTMTMGLEHMGPSNATVTIGNYWYDADPHRDDDRIYFYGNSEAGRREFRLFSHDGYDSATGLYSTGNVNVIQNLYGATYGTLTKVGNGTVTLLGQTNAAIDSPNDVRNITLLGGDLVLDRSSTLYPRDVQRLTDQPGGTVTLAGGNLIYLGASNINTYERMSGNLTVRAGDSEVAVLAGTYASTNTLMLATNATASIIRQRGGTVNFIEDQGPTPSLSNVANILLNVSLGNRLVGPWATYGTNVHGPGFTWAATDASGNLQAFTGYSNDVYGAGFHTDVSVATNFTTAQAVASLRFSQGTAIGLGGSSLNITNGGILVAPTVTSTASVANGYLTSSGGELTIHNYHGADGNFSVGAAITGKVDLTLSGSGTTILSGANTYSGNTYLNGGALQIDNASRLGNTVSNLEMRGGTLSTIANVDLGTRNIILGGDGGTFQTAAGTTNTIGGIVDTESHFILATRGNNAHGDLIKTGDGTLVIGGAASVNNTYEGLTDIRGGTMLITRNNNNVLGSSKSFYDGTIIRGGATLAVAAMTNAGNATPYSREWIMFEEGSTLDIMDPNPGYQAYRWNSVWDLRGDATIRVRGDEFNLGSDGAGYLMGSGALIKDGDGLFRNYVYSPEFTGEIIVRDGNFWDYGYRNFALPNAASITLGTADATNRGSVAFLVQTGRDGNDATVDVNQDIFVLGHSSDTRIGTIEADHNDVINFNGNIDLGGFNTAGTNLQFQLYVQDDVNSISYGAATEYRQEYFLNLNGDISGGDKAIRTYLYSTRYSTPTYNQGQDNGFTTTNEFDMMAFFTLTGSNTGWTGSLEVGNRTSTSPETGGPDQDKQHFVRFGNNDGNPTLAIGSNNWVVLRHNATLQAHGSQVTIGSLFSDGSDGGTDGYFGNQYVSNTFIENGGTVAGTMRVYQTTNSAFDGTIRDGTYYSTTATNLASAALNFVKAGPGTLALGGSNYYTGATVLEGGALRLNSANALPGGIGTTGGSSLLIMSNGVIGLAHEDFLRDLGTGISNVTWAAGGGFAAYGADRYVHFGGQTQSLAWGQANFISGDHDLMFGAVDSTHTIIFDNALDLSGGNRRIQVLQGGTNVGARILSTLFGSGGLVKTGTGTLELFGSNSYSGPTIIAGGSLHINNVNALPGGVGATGGSSALQFTNGGILILGYSDFSRNLGTGGSNVSWSGSGGFTAYGADRHVNIGGQTQALEWGQANFISGDNELVLAGPGATHTLIFENDIALAGTNRFRADDGLAYVDGRITGDISDKSGSVGTLWKTGDGILELTGSNTWSGGIDVLGGQVLFSGPYAMPDGGVLNISNFAIVGLGADLTRSLGTNDGQVVWTGSGGFYASGADRFVNLGGATGQVTWGGGFFVPEIVDGSVLVLSASNATHTLDFQNPIDLGASNRTLLVHNGGAGIDAKLSGSLSGSGGLVKTGNGVLALGAANTYTGRTLVTGGMLSVSNLNALGTDPAAYISNQITLNGGGIQITENLNLDSHQGIFLAANGGTIDVTTARIVTNVNILAGQGSFTKSGDGTLVMPTANTYTGRTILAGGTLSISNEAALGPNPAATVNNQLTFNGGSLQITENLTLDDSRRNITIESGGGTFDVVSGVTFTNARIIYGTTAGFGNLTKTGAGTLENRTDALLSDLNVAEGTARFGAGTLRVTNALTANGGSTLRLATTAYINDLFVSNANLLFEGGDMYVRDFHPDFASMPSNGLVFAASGGYKYLFQDLSETNVDVTLDIPKLIYDPATDPNTIVFGRSGGTNVAEFNIGSIEWTNRRVFRVGAMSTPDGADASVVNINGIVQFTNAVAQDYRYFEARSIYGGVVNVNSNIIINQGLDVAREFIFQGNGEIRLNSDILAVDGALNATAFTNIVRIDGWRNLKMTVDEATRFGDSRAVYMYAGSVLKFDYDVSADPLGYPGLGRFATPGGGEGRGWYLEYGVTQSDFSDPFLANTGLIVRGWTGVGGNLSNAVYSGGALAGQNIYLQTNAAIMEGTLNAPTAAAIGANTLYMGLLSPTNTFDLNSLDSVYKGVALGAMTLVGGGRNSIDYPATDEGYSGTLNARTGQDLEVAVFGEVFVEPVSTNVFARFNADTGIANFRGPGSLILQSGNGMPAFGGTATNLNRIGVAGADGFGFDSQGNVILDLVNDMAVGSNTIVSARNGLVRVRANGALGAVTASSNVTLVIGSGASFWTDNANNNDSPNFFYNRGKVVFEDDGAFYVGRYADRFDATNIFLGNMVFGSNSLLVLNDNASADTATYRSPGLRRLDTAGYTHLTTNMNVVFGGAAMRTALVANSEFAFALADGHRLTHAATTDANIDRIFRTNGTAAVEVDIRAQAGSSNVLIVANSGRTMHIRPNVVTSNALWTTFGSTNRFITVLADSAVRSNALGAGTVNLLGNSNLFQNVEVAAGTANFGGQYAGALDLNVNRNATFSNFAATARYGDAVNSGTATFAGGNVRLANVESRGISNTSAAVRFFASDLTVSNVLSTGGGDVVFGADAGDRTVVQGDITMHDGLFDNPSINLAAGSVSVLGNIYMDNTISSNPVTHQAFTPTIYFYANTNHILGSVYIGPTNGSVGGSGILYIGDTDTDSTIIGGDLVLNSAASRDYSARVQRGDLVVSNNIIVNSLGIDPRTVTNDWVARPNAIGTLFWLQAEKDINLTDGIGLMDRLRDGTLALGSDGIILKPFGLMLTDFNRTNYYPEGWVVGQKITIDTAGPNYGATLNTGGEQYNLWMRTQTNLLSVPPSTGGGLSPVVALTNMWLRDNAHVRVNEDSTSVRLGLVLEGSSSNGTAVLSEGTGTSDDVDLVDIRSSVAGQARTLQIGTTNGVGETGMDSVLFGTATEDVTLDVRWGSLTVTNGGGNFLGLARAGGIAATTNSLIRLIATDPVASLNAISGRVEIADYARADIRVPRTNMAMTIATPIRIANTGPTFVTPTNANFLLANIGGGSGTTTVNVTNVTMANGSWLRVDEDGTQQANVALALEGTVGGGRAILSKTTGFLNDNFDLLDVRSDTAGQNRTVQIGATNSALEAMLTSTLRGAAAQEVTFDVFNGRLNLAAGADIQGSARVMAGSVLDTSANANETLMDLAGNGTVIGNVTVSNTLAPGMSIGTLTITGGLHLVSTSVLNFELSGTSTNAGQGINDLVQLAGPGADLVLDGTLMWTNVASVTGWGEGDFWTLMTYEGSLSNNLVELNPAYLPDLDEGLIWLLNLDTLGEVRLSVAVPEPRIWILLVGGFTLVTALARRKRASKPSARL